MNRSLNRSTRKLHRWGAILTLLPLLVVISTGILLQVKKESTWIQPATAVGTEGDPLADWETILQTVKQNPKSEVASWQDINRLDVRPNKGIVKVQCSNRWEIQIDLITGAEVASNYRRSDLIESLHDGSFFHEQAKLWVFLPNGLILLGLWFTGAYLWWLPFRAKRIQKKRKQQKILESKTETPF